MTAPVVRINPFVILGRMDARLDQLLAFAIRLNNDDLLHYVEVMKELRDELREALQQERRERTVEQLEQSIALNRAKHRPIDFTE